MKSTKLAVLIALVAAVPTSLIVLPAAAIAGEQAAPATEPESDVDKAFALGWVKGPATVSIAGKAEIKIPKGYMYLGEQETQTFLKLNGNLPSPGNYTIAKSDFGWFAIYSFNPAGYVNDKEAIDPDALFKSIKDRESAENDERNAAGLDPMYLDAWVVSPHYDTTTRQLEWGTRLHSTNNATIVNYTSRILGRSGVMSAVLVSDPENLDKQLADFRHATGKFEYVAGEKYEQFQNGDKVAEYGLAALITGGAAAAAAKTGLGKAAFAGVAAFGKVIFAAVVAAFVAVASFLRRLFGRKAE